MGEIMPFQLNKILKELISSFRAPFILKKRLGQTYSIDLLISAAVIITIIVIQLNIFYQKQVLINDLLLQKEISEASNNVIYRLTKTEGLPSDWQGANMESIGLAVSEYSNNVLSAEKIDRFNSLNYEIIKQGLGISNYEFRLELINTTTGGAMMIKGNNLTSNKTFFASTPVIIENQSISDALIYLWVWINE